MGTVLAQFGEAVLESETRAMPSANVKPVSDQVWDLMSPGLQEVSKECNVLFNRLPAWHAGVPWRSLPGTRREWVAEHTMPCGAQPREELGSLIREIEREGQVVQLRPRAKARPDWEPSPFSNWEGP